MFRTWSIMLIIHFLYMAFIMLRNAPSIPTLLSVFYHKLVLDFIKYFFHIYWYMIMAFLYFILFMWCITFIDLQILYHPCIPGMIPTWSWCMIFLMYCWMQFANILFRILASMFISNIGLRFSFFVMSLFSFGIRMMSSSWKELGSLPPSWIFWNNLWRMRVSSPLNVL